MVVASVSADRAVHAQLDELFRAFQTDTDSAKAPVARRIVQCLRTVAPSGGLAAALNRVVTLLQMIDADHIDDLDGEMAALRVVVERHFQADRRTAISGSR